MRKTTIVAMLATAFTVSVSAMAGEWITNWGTITQIESYGDDFHVYGLNLSQPNSKPCSQTGYGKVDYRLTAAKKEGLSRALTAAFLAGRQVKVKVQTDYCEGNYPAIYGVMVQ
jgi:hypothetical protein